MKFKLFLFALTLAVAVTGCKTDPSSPDVSSQRVSSKGGEASNSVFDIPTPIAGTAVRGAVNTNGHNIDITWSYPTPASSYYLSTLYYPQGKTTPRPYGLVPTSTLNPTYIYQFWGGSQRAIVQTPTYSGHYDIERSLDSINWIEIGSTTGTSYTDAGPGGLGLNDNVTYFYRVKSKSLEGSIPDLTTHHSRYSAGMRVGNGGPTNCVMDTSYSIGSPDGTYQQNYAGNLIWMTTSQVQGSRERQFWYTSFRLYRTVTNECDNTSATQAVMIGDNDYGIALYSNFNGGGWMSIPFDASTGEYLFDLVHNNVLYNPTLMIPGNWQLLISTSSSGSPVFATVTVVGG